MATRRDHAQFNVSSGVTDEGLAWAELYSSSGNKRFEQVVEDDQEADAVSRQLEAQAVAVARKREADEMEQVAFQQRLTQFKSAYELSSDDQKAQLRQALGLEHPKKKVENTHE